MGFMNYTLVGSDNAADMTVGILAKQAKRLLVNLRVRSNEYNTPGYVNVAMFIREVLMKQASHIKTFCSTEYKVLAEMCKQRLEIEFEKKESLDRSELSEYKEHFKNIKSLIRDVEKFQRAIK